MGDHDTEVDLNHLKMSHHRGELGERKTSRLKVENLILDLIEEAQGTSEGGFVFNGETVCELLIDGFNSHEERL